MAVAAKTWEGNRALRRLLVPLDTLAPHPDNPRVHDLPVISASLARFGQQRPILVVPAGRVDANRATIVAGHGTTAGAAELGWTHVAIIESDLTDAEIEAYLAADNRVGDLGSYEDDRLLALLKRIDEGPGLEGVGYGRDDLDDLLASLQEKAPANPNAQVLRDTSYAEFLQRYANRQTRGILLDFATASYGWVVDALEAYREREGLASNAAAVVHLLAAALDREPPEEADATA